MSSRIKSRLSPEGKALAEKAAAFDKHVGENWANPAFQAEMAEAITETVYLGFDHENLTELMAETEYVDYNGRVFVREAKGLKAFWVAPGGYIEESTLKTDVFEIPRDTVGIHVREMEDKLESGFSETSEMLTSLAAVRLDAQINLRVLAAFQAAIPVASPYYITAAGVSLAALNTAIREVADESSGHGDGEIIILGRRTMLDQIMNRLQEGTGTSGFLPETNEAMLRMGVLGVYNGCRLVALRNFRDGDDVPFFPANEMYVIGRNASKAAFFGDLKAKAGSEFDNWYWHWLARLDFGITVYRPSRLRRIVDSSIAPSTVVEQ